MTYTPGHERIPNNWYRRPLGGVNGYSPVSFAGDLAHLAAEVPEAFSVDGDTGIVNSFDGVDLDDVTGGAYHTTDLTDRTKFVCSLYQLTLAFLPEWIRSESLGSGLRRALSLLGYQTSPCFDLSCAKIGDFSNSNSLLTL